MAKRKAAENEPNKRAKISLGDSVQQDATCAAKTSTWMRIPRGRVRSRARNSKPLPSPLPAARKRRFLPIFNARNTERRG